MFLITISSEVSAQTLPWDFEKSVAYIWASSYSNTGNGEEICDEWQDSGEDPEADPGSYADASAACPEAESMGSLFVDANGAFVLVVSAHARGGPEDVSHATTDGWGNFAFRVPTQTTLAITCHM